MGACASCLGLHSHDHTDEEVSPLLRGRQGCHGRDRRNASLPHQEGYGSTGSPQRDAPQRNALKCAAQKVKGVTPIHDSPPMLNEKSENEEQPPPDAVVKQKSNNLRNAGTLGKGEVEARGQTKMDSAYGTGSDTNTSAAVESLQKQTRNDPPETLSQSSPHQENPPGSTESTMPYQVQRYSKRPAIQKDTFTPPKTPNGDIEQMPVPRIVDGHVVCGEGGRREIERQ